ncbi:MAG: ParB/RepB/Spo0J family partition protein [Actinobacteria bacterium]|nr:ParB/RepB/Spo0J family partition protein [Actinomycetota bacterium]
MSPHKSRLGRGLDSLVSTESFVSTTPRPAPATATKPSAAPGNIQFVPVDEIQPNPLQPRSHIDPTELSGLVDSLRTSGLLQPILVRRHGSSFQLIAGERRWRAARQAGLRTVPTVVRDASDDDMLELALIENIQRSDLNAADRAAAYSAYLSRLNLTQEQASHRLGQDRATIANYVRLLELDEEVRQLLAQGDISMGQARALLAVSDPADQRRLAKLVVAKNLSVRRTEDLVRELRRESSPTTKPVEKLARQANLRELEDKLSHRLGRKIRIRCRDKSGKGELVMSFSSVGDFDELVAKLCKA